MNLATDRGDYNWTVNDLYTSQKNANIQAAAQRKGKPGAGGLIMGLAGAALSGVQAGMALKAPSAGKLPGANDLGSVAQANNVKVKPGYYGPAF
jgi:hypothetical protein